MTNDALDHDHLLDLAAGLATAYVSNNPLPVADLPGLVPAIYAKLVGLTVPEPAAQEETTEHKTPAEIRKSITPDALISFVDGRPYKTLKRHLTQHGLDHAGYQARYGLPADYPTVAPNYSTRRSELAKAIGLGRPARVPMCP